MAGEKSHGDRKQETRPVGTLAHVGMDVEDLERSETFYSALPGVKRASTWEQHLIFEPLAGGLTVYLQRVPEKKTANTGLHMDLSAPDVPAALVRVESLVGRAPPAGMPAHSRIRSSRPCGRCRLPAAPDGLREQVRRRRERHGPPRGPNPARGVQRRMETDA